MSDLEHPPNRPSFVARCPTDLVAMVPVALGFHPQDSVVVLSLGPRGRGCHARVDLPTDAAEHAAVARMLAEALAHNGATATAVLLYSSDVAVVEAQADEVVGALRTRGIDVVAVLRVDDGRWFGVPDEGSEGTGFDLTAHPFTVQRVYEGHVTHRRRQDLVATLVGTDEVDAAAVEHAAGRHADLLLTEAAPVDEAHRAAFLAAEARWLQRLVRRSLVGGTPLSPADAGRVLVLVALIQLRDVAWSELRRATARRHVELWRDLVRRAPRDLVPGPAALLAFSAWQAGDGALAWCAVDRCLEVDPDYSLAHIIVELLTRAVPPDTWQPVPPEELPVFTGMLTGGDEARDRHVS